MEHPEIFYPSAKYEEKRNTLQPVYPLTRGVSQLLLQKAVRQGLDACRELLPDVLPDAVRMTHQLCYVNYAYENIHFPASFEALAQAHRRLVFEELFLVTCGLHLLRSRRVDVAGPMCRAADMQPFYDALPFPLTDAQRRAIGDAAELEAALTQKRDELAQKQAEYDAIALAMESLQSANTALQNRFSPALSRRAGELFSRLTGGKYESVLLDRTFSAQAGETGKSVSHDAQLLSLGTLDQLYLAVRLAICESALPADDPPPIVLDDALVRFDDERCRAALELLLEESKSRQILLFTCQHRESAYLSGRDGVTFLSL